ncbi:MAG TPA: hypothetical protein VKR05_00645 [Candidatus Cybelea sp.]|nr:hypothetical protein [Candidatus Cybelea sp.]
MHVRPYTGVALSATIAFVLTACAGYQPPSAAYQPASAVGARSVLPEGFRPNTTRPAWMKAPPIVDASAKGHIAVAQFGGSSVLWFLLNDKKNKQPTDCQPASSTNGIAIDRYGDLWVPDGRADSTTEYAPNCGSAKLTIPDPTGEPADVGFSGKNRVYILNLNNHSGPPTVEVYNATSGNQVGTLSDPSFNVLFGIGTDQHGNVFVSNLTTNNVGIVIEFPNGKMPGTQLSGVALGLPGAPTFDRSNNLIIADWFNYTIDVFAPPYTGSPSVSTLKGASIWCKLNHKQTDLYCGDADNGSIDVYAYPGNTYRYSYTAGLSASALVTGVAPDPAAAYK